jgi:hypothetical protein
VARRANAQNDHTALAPNREIFGRLLLTSSESRYYTITNRAAVIEQLKATQETLNKLLTLLESSEADKFVAHLYQARKHCRLVCERRNKGNKAIEREIIASFQVAQSLGLYGRPPSVGAPAADSRLPVNFQFAGVHSLDQCKQLLGAHNGVRSDIRVINMIPQPMASLNRQWPDVGNRRTFL